MTSGGGFRALIQAGGGKALYAGVFGNLAGVAPASAIFMAVYEPVKVGIPAFLLDPGALLLGVVVSCWAHLGARKQRCVPDV
jgi:hypothetical protein